MKHEGIEIRVPLTRQYSEILSPDALQFLSELHRNFDGRRLELLHKRQIRQKEISAGKLPHFLEETKHIRETDWKVADIPKDLLERKVEITGPVDAKMIINALNSGASVYMADFEDSHAPTWDNTLQGQINLKETINDTITFTSPEGKKYELKDKTATLMVRPRGWHLHEKHVLIDGKAMSASLFDFGLFLFHNAHKLIKKGTGPYFYLPKMESHLEARLWNDVFNFSQDALKIPRGTIRATALLETILAAFEMDEILYELRHHSAGLNCGRWDYIFSVIKKFRNYPEFVFPDRAQVTMDKHFLHAYVELLIKTCHRRGAHAMGGMAAQIPIKNDAKANETALEKVRQDKLREVKAGHDGTWVAHPGLVSIAREIFDNHLKEPNQIGNKRLEVKTTEKDLIAIPKGDITEQGLRTNIDVGVRYLESWLRGVGCVPIYNLMEDAATAEISRSQVWQWIHHGAKMTNGKIVTDDLVKEILIEELNKIRKDLGADIYDAGQFERASILFEQMMTAKEFPEFLTLAAYEYLD